MSSQSNRGTVYSFRKRSFCHNLFLRTSFFRYHLITVDCKFSNAVATYCFLVRQPVHLHMNHIFTRIPYHESWICLPTWWNAFIWRTFSLTHMQMVHWIPCETVRRVAWLAWHLLVERHSRRRIHYVQFHTRYDAWRRCIARSIAHSNYIPQTYTKSLHLANIYIFIYFLQTPLLINEMCFCLVWNIRYPLVSATRYVWFLLIYLFIWKRHIFKCKYILYSSQIDNICTTIRKKCKLKILTKVNRFVKTAADDESFQYNLSNNRHPWKKHKVCWKKIFVLAGSNLINQGTS